MSKYTELHDELIALTDKKTTMNKLREECHELISAINDYKIKDLSEKELILEMADVRTMIDRLFITLQPRLLIAIMETIGIEKMERAIKRLRGAE